jgi:fructoselysine-6-P-deglycase FrlB-like protein
MPLSPTRIRADALRDAAGSDYFTGARIAEDLPALLERRGAAARSLADLIDPEVNTLYLVGSGGSYADMLQAKYVFDALTDVRTEVLTSYEVLWRAPRLLDERAVYIVASLSGETEDAVAAMGYATARGANTVSLVRSEDSTLGRTAKFVVPFDSAACYEGPVVLLALLAGELAARSGRTDARDEIESSLASLPGILARAVDDELIAAEAKAEEFLSSNHMYVLGAGALSALAYKVALTVVMENIRIAGTYCDASEFRHGPAEALDRTRPDMMFLVGTDAARGVTLSVIELCKSRGARVLIYDAANYPGVHPLLSGLLVNSLTQCFVVHSAIKRGILNLDERVFMGHGVLGGPDARWP